MAQQVKKLHDQQSRKRQNSPIFGTLDKERIVYSKRARKSGSTKQLRTKRSMPTLRTIPRPQPPELVPIDQAQYLHSLASSPNSSNSNHKSSQPPLVTLNRASKRLSAQQAASQLDNSRHKRKDTLRKVGKYDKHGNKLIDQMFSQKPTETKIKTKKTVKRNKLVCLPDLLPPQDIPDEIPYVQDNNVDANEELSDSASVSSDGIEAKPLGYSLSALRRQVKRCTLLPKDLSRARRRQHALRENSDGKVISDGFEPHEVEFRRRSFWRSRRGKTTFLPYRPRLQMIGDIFSQSAQHRDQQHVDAVSTNVVQYKEKQDTNVQSEDTNREAADDEPYVIDADSGPCRVIDDATGNLDPTLDENMPLPTVQLQSRRSKRPERVPAQAQSDDHLTQAHCSSQMAHEPVDTIAALTSAYELYCNDSAQLWQAIRPAAELSELHALEVERSSEEQTHTQHAAHRTATDRSTLRAPHWSTMQQILNGGNLPRSHNRAVIIEVPMSPVVVLATSPIRMRNCV